MAECSETARALAAQCRALLLRLPGIYAASVRLDDAGGVSELHIVASNARNPKQISRDVQSALLASFELPVDHRVISIAQLSANPFEENEEPDILDSDIRLQCLGVTTRVEGDRYYLNVHLRQNGQDFEGNAECRNTPTQRCHAAAQATLNAVHASLGVEDAFTVIAAQTIMVSGIAIAITILEYASAQSERLLIGAARQGDAAATGFVKSTLDALNRSFAKAAQAG